MAGDRPRDYIVQPVDRALSVLAYVVERGRMVSLKAVSEALDMPKTTAFRYLQTLVHSGFLDFDPVTEKYRCGARLRTMSRAEDSLSRIRTVAAPLLGRLAEEFGETANLAGQGDGAVVYLDLVQPRRKAQQQARVGDAHPMHSTALGKAILAFLPPDERKSYLHRPLHERTGRTMIDRAELERQLSRVQVQGYAVETGENEDGLMCVGVPVLDAAGYPVAAISLTAPVGRFGRGVPSAVGSRLCDLSQRITSEIGGRAALVPAHETFRG